MAIYQVLGNKKFFGVIIEKTGAVDAKKLYTELIPWFSKYDYFFTEKEISMKDTLAGQKQKFKWIGNKKIDDYFRFNIYIEIWISPSIKDKSQVLVRFKGYLETDYRNKFKGKVGAFLRKLYEDYFIKERIIHMKKKVLAETNDLINTSKKILNLVSA